MYYQRSVAYSRTLLCLFVLLVMPMMVEAENTLSERTYRSLSAIHELMDKEHYDEALGKLRALASSVSFIHRTSPLRLQLLAASQAH